MKSINSLTILFMLSSFASCENQRKENYEIHAQVMHQDGSPFEGANLSALKLVAEHTEPILVATPKRTEIVQTDGTGRALLAFQSIPYPSGGVAIGKKGYYASIYPNVKWIPIDKYDDGRWTTEIKTILKPIKNPIPMIVSRGERMWLNQLDQAFGYDLEIQAMLPPYGHGKHADIEFTVTGDYKDRNQYDLKLDVIFPNPDDGLVEFLTPQRTSMEEPNMDGSTFISDYEAPERGYLNQIARSSRKGIGDARSSGDSDHRRNHYFRVRTQKDDAGNIINAHYGKIYGDFGFAGGNLDVSGNYASVIWIACYFNPESNDRNVEFATNKNLHSVKYHVLKP